MTPSVRRCTCTALLALATTNVSAQESYDRACLGDMLDQYLAAVIK